MAEILDKLRLVVYPNLYIGGLHNPGGCLGFLNHQQYCFALKFAKFLEDERIFEDVVSCDMAMGQWTHLLG